jgi:hypothetical protein
VRKDILAGWLVALWQNYVHMVFVVLVHARTNFNFVESRVPPGSGRLRSQLVVVMLDWPEERVEWESGPRGWLGIAARRTSHAGTFTRMERMSDIELPVLVVLYVRRASLFYNKVRTDHIPLRVLLASVGRDSKLVVAKTKLCPLVFQR